MRTERSILEEYRKGGSCWRLNMYLEHRDLRPHFAQIESDERALPKAAVSGEKGERSSPTRSLMFKSKRSNS
jgi:hypothetical protein